MIEQFKSGVKEHTYYTLIAVGMTVGLCVEFFLLKYGILKVLRYVIFLAGLWMIAWIDWKEQRIPNKVLLTLSEIRAGILLIECIVYSEYFGTLLLSFICGALTAGGMFLICYFLSRGGMGAGDVKLMTVAGFYLGLGVVFTDIFLSVLAAALFSILLLVLKKIKIKEEISFAPFVLVGTILTMALGM